MMMIMNAKKISDGLYLHGLGLILIIISFFVVFVKMDIVMGVLGFLVGWVFFILGISDISRGLTSKDVPRKMKFKVVKK